MQKPEGVSQLVEHLFRHEGAKMVATLTRIFGIEHLTLAEDVVQEALGGRCRLGRSTEFRKILQHGLCARRAISRWTWFADKKYFNKQAEITHLMDRDRRTPESDIFRKTKLATTVCD